MLIVTANVLTLLLSRSARHRHEAVIQRALGAGRGRIIRQVLAESVILGSAGAIIGLGISYASLELLKSMARVDVPELFQLAARQQFGSWLSVPAGGRPWHRLGRPGVCHRARSFSQRHRRTRTGPADRRRRAAPIRGRRRLQSPPGGIAEGGAHTERTGSRPGCHRNHAARSRGSS